MSKFIKNNKKKIFVISPMFIKYCIFPSKLCDYTQFKSLRSHPHAGIDRGVFKEDPYGRIKINNSKWDSKPGPIFSNLLEYIALRNHYNGKENWKNSEFASRNINYINMNNIKNRGFRNSKTFLVKRERQIDNLFESIIKKGVHKVYRAKNAKLFNDNISVVLTGENRLYFNNRGHHRLAIAKILKLKKIPIKITLAKSVKNFNNFIALINKTNY